MQNGNYCPKFIKFRLFFVLLDAYFSVFIGILAYLFWHKTTDNQAFMNFYLYLDW